jgi:hypothetical protein
MTSKLLPCRICGRPKPPGKGRAYCDDCKSERSQSGRKLVLPRESQVCRLSPQDQRARRDAAPAGMRWCNRCESYKDAAGFTTSYCKVCHEDYHRDYRYQRQYGITLAEYELMLELQGGGCAICGSIPKLPKGKRSTSSASARRLHVDHDHKTGKVRGLLCWTCNYRLIGVTQDPERLRAAARYLERPPADEALLAV